MTQRRDERRADTSSIEELGSVALPTRVGSTRSGLMPAFVVGALLVAVVAVGVSGRTEAPRTEVPPLAAAPTSPAPSASESPAPSSSPQPSTRPATPEPTPRYEPTEPWSPDLRFWLVVLSDGQRLLRTDLELTDGFYRTVPIEGAWGDDVRARLVGRGGTDGAVPLADVRVPRVPDGSLDLPLELAGGLVDAVTLGSSDRSPRRGPSVLRYEIRLEQGCGSPGSGLLVAEVTRPSYITYSDPANLDEARDRALASGEVQEALTHSPRCSRMLDPRTGRSAANLDGCLRFFARQGVTWTVTPGEMAPTAPATPSPPPTLPPPSPDGATYWLDLRLDSELIDLQPLQETADGTYQASFPYPETWYVKAPVLGLYGHNTIDGWPVTMATLQLTKGPRGVPGLPVVLASAPSPLAGGAVPIWSVTLIRGQPHGLAVVVDVRP